jgi:hypothetical protein
MDNSGLGDASLDAEGWAYVAIWSEAVTITVKPFGADYLITDLIWGRPWVWAIKLVGLWAMSTPSKELGRMDRLFIHGVPFRLLGSTPQRSPGLPDFRPLT